MTTATNRHQFAPLMDTNNLEHTILDPAKSDKDLIIRLPKGIFEDVSELRLPARLKQLKVTDAGTVITDLQRAADRVVQSISEYYEVKSPENLMQVKETVGVFVRNVYKHLGWRFEDLINVRDSENTSSAYLVGVPAIRHNAFVDGKLCDLMPWQVSLHPALVKKLGVENGQRVQLCRFPETATRVVEVITDDTLGRHVIGLPIGEPNLAKLLGGDCDGDCYAIRAFHTLDCQEELNKVFEQQWADRCEPVLSNVVLTWQDEAPSGKSDEDISTSKFFQKVAIGPVALDAYSAFIIKLAAKDRLPLSFAQIRDIMEISLETVMDMKKVEGKDCLLLHRLMSGERELDLLARAELDEQGYALRDVELLVEFISSHGGDIRKLARSNPAYNALIGGPDAVGQFIETAQEDVCQQFIDNIFGRNFRKPGPRRYHEKLTRNKGRYGNAFFMATMDRRTGEIVVECGLAEYRIQASEEGKAIRLSPTEVALFRPTVEVNFIERDGELSTSCTIHHGWPSIMNTIARTEYAWEIWEIVSQPDADIARADLERLVKKILRRTLKTYELEGVGLNSWDAVSAMQRYVVLDTDLPKIEGHDFIELEMMRRQAAAETLVKRGLINHRSDTTCGNPGMAFYAKAGKDVTSVTKSDPLNCLASLKRSSVRNALGNLVQITGAQPESFITDSTINPPVVELHVACLPINSMDAVMVSTAVIEKLTAKVPVVIGSLDFGSYEYHQLEDGSKIQGRLDLKGVVRVIPEENMPFIRYADGTTVRAEVIMPLDSRSHEMLTHSHCTLALTAAAQRLKETSGGRMNVPHDVTVERAAKVAQRSGLYDSSDLNAEILRPDGDLLGQFPAGMAALGVHRQIPSILSSTHSRERITEYFPTTTSSGGVVSGLAGALCMMAEGLDCCCEELHTNINPDLEAEIQALRSCIVRC